MNFRYKLMQYMSGRHGPDMLTYFLLGCAFAVSFINIFLSVFVSRVVTALVQLIVYALLGYAVFRFLSRNISARRRENDWFVSKLNLIKRKREFNNQKKADKCHVYKKCPYCKAVLRLPHRLGKHKTVCPKCGKEFNVTVRK